MMIFLSRPIVAILLHAANRDIRNHYFDDVVVNAFYSIKDRILKVYGKVLGYDVQHIKGKVCRSCAGTGEFVRYSMYPPYKAYDWDACWHCNGTGYYRMPKWICLHRIRMWVYQFHKPLKREECIKNPFTKEELGWDVTERPVIEGYIEHDKHWFGFWSIMLFLFIFNRPLFKSEFKDFVHWRNVRIRNWFANARRPEFWLMRLPVRYHFQWMNADGSFRQDDDLPF